MKKPVSLIISIVAIFIFAIHVGASTQMMHISGSTTVQKRILAPAKSAIKDETGITLRVRGINSGNGFEELRKGLVPASIASSPLELLLENAGMVNDNRFQEHKLMEDVIVPIVNSSNPVSELTWKQLSDINTGKITNWKEVGGPALAIQVITSQPTAATRKVFQKQVMRKQPYVENAMEVKSTRHEIALVEDNMGAIGAVSEGFVRMFPDMVKVIGTARISRPLSFITKGDPTPDVQQIIDFLKTPRAKRLFK